MGAVKSAVKAVAAACQETINVRISAIVDDCFSLIVDGVSTPSWTRGDARKRGV